MPVSQPRGKNEVSAEHFLDLRGSKKQDTVTKAGRPILIDDVSPGGGGSSSSGCDGVVCCLGCLSVFPGVKRRIVDKVAFFPPQPPGYIVGVDGSWMMRENDGTYERMPDLSSSHIDVKGLRLPTSAGNLICALHFKKTNAKGRKTIIFSHGNSTDVGCMFSSFKDLCHKCNVNVLAYDYSGYGFSTGVTSERHIYSDIQAVYYNLTDDLEISPKDIILYGQSVGSAAAIDLASQVGDQLGGVILHAALKSGLSVLHGTVQKPPWFDVFQNVTKIKDVEVPVFIIHGTADQEVAFDHGVALHDACKYPFQPWWVHEGGHNDIELIWRSTYFLKIRNFLESLDKFSRLAQGEKFVDGPGGQVAGTASRATTASSRSANKDYISETSSATSSQQLGRSAPLQQSRSSKKPLDNGEPAPPEEQPKFFTWLFQ